MGGRGASGGIKGTSLRPLSSSENKNVFHYETIKTTKLTKDYNTEFGFKSTGRNYYIDKFGRINMTPLEYEKLTSDEKKILHKYFYKSGDEIFLKDNVGMSQIKVVYNRYREDVEDAIKPVTSYARNLGDSLRKDNYFRDFMETLHTYPAQTNKEKMRLAHPQFKKELKKEVDYHVGKIETYAKKFYTTGKKSYLEKIIKYKI